MSGKKPSDQPGLIKRMSSVDAALDLAHKWMDEKRADLFRGQVFPWAPTSSLTRWRGRSAKGDTRSLTPALNRFVTWASNLPEMAPLAGEEAKLIAIAQHFGIPTDYVDFTLSPSIASLFSRDRVPDTEFESTDSCLYCLNLDSMRAWFEPLPPEKGTEYQIYPVQFILPELHRLHAQMGTFLHAPGEWYRRFEPDCILFPRGPVLNDFERLTLYPPTSKLEEDLQAFTQANDTTEFAEYVERLGGTVIHMRPPSSSIRASYFTSGPPVHADWRDDHWKCGRFRPYVQPFVIKYPEQTVKMGNLMFAEALRHQLKGILSEHTNLWDIPLNFQVAPTSRLLEEAEALCMSEALTRAWNGMAAFPYTHEDLLDCFQRIVFLAASGINSGSVNIDPKLVRMLSQPVDNKNRWIKISMQSHNGASSEGLCSYGELEEALLSDLPEFLSPEGRAAVSADLMEFIRQTRVPSMIFEFGPLLRSFVENFIPTQALLRRSDQPMLFSPAQITDFWPNLTAHSTSRI